MRPDRVVIGRVIRPHGLRGEVRVERVSDHEDRFSALTRILLTREGIVLGEFEVERSRRLGAAVGIKLRGIDSPEAASALCGAQIEATPPAAASLPEDTYYTFDLVGLDVASEDGTRLGVVADVLSFPANDVLLVKNGATERLIPFVASVIHRVDLIERRITIHLLPGLLDL